MEVSRARMAANAREFDLAVIGSGPAGASAAITAARQDRRVLLLEAGEFPRHKVCGEFVSAESLDVLRVLVHGLERADAVLSNAPIIDCTRLLLGNRIVEAAISPAALSLPRYDLDALLWEAAVLAGVDARSSCEVTGIEGDGPFRVLTGDSSFAAKAVIVAAGRWSRFQPDRSVPAGPKWIGVKAHFRERNPSASTDLYFFENGYCGVQPIANDAVNACAMVRSDRATTLAEVFALHSRLAERAAGWSAITQSVSTAPLIYREPRPVRGNILFAGDAAGFIDPFVGDGISIALRSGEIAALRLERFLAGDGSLTNAAEDYAREYARQFAPLLGAASRVRSMLSLPSFARQVAFEMLRLPGIMPLVIRKTRRAS